MRLIALSLVLISVSLAVACGADKDGYVRPNAALLADVPVFPGAAELSREDSAYRLTESGPVAGYGTRVTYRVPAGASEADVVTFLQGSLDAGCQQSVEEIPPIDLLTGRSLEPTRQYHFCRGNALIGLDVLNLPNGAFDLYADHNYGQDGSRSMPCR